MHETLFDDEDDVDWACKMVGGRCPAEIGDRRLGPADSTAEESAPPDGELADIRMRGDSAADCSDDDRLCEAGESWEAATQWGSALDGAAWGGSL